jgi:hypothetical protein
MPGDDQGHEELGQAGDDKINQEFGLKKAAAPVEPEPIEEISDLEEITEAPKEDEGLPIPDYESPPDEIDLEHTSYVPIRQAVAPESPVPFDELGEIEVELPEATSSSAGYEPTGGARLSVDTEGSGLTFIKFETPTIGSEGNAVLPALFLDGAGNPVRIRIRIQIDEGA